MKEKDINQNTNYKKLKKNGIKCLLFDLDNTCVPYKDKVPNKKLIDLIETLKDMDFKVIIFSNSPRKRIKPFKDKLNIDALASARKPRKESFLKIMKLFGYNLSEIAIIGDQLYTDILGGNRVGIKTILVNPMSNDDMFITRFIYRPLEKRIYKKLTSKNILIRGKYYE